MLTALNQEGQLTNLLTQQPAKKDIYYCPGCHGKVQLKQGKIMRVHFAHIHLQDCWHHSENESSQHLELKSILYRWLEKEATVELEAYLPSNGQIADLLVNQQLALEVQCSSLPIQRLIERTQSYHQHGYKVVWLLGENLWLKKSLSSLQKQFLRFSQNMGFHLWELDAKRKELRLRYLIHEDWRGRVHCLTQTFPFGKKKLLEVLRLPYARQRLLSFKGQMDTQLLRYIAQQLYYQSPKWMALQRQAYEAGENLLTKSLEDFYPQLRLPTSEIGFAQISETLDSYYQNFEAYYKTQKNKQKQVLYSPAFYRRTES